MFNIFQKMFEVENVMKHPDYDFDIRRSDIMILRVRQQVQLRWLVFRFLKIQE